MSESLFRAAILARSGWAVAGLLVTSFAFAQSTVTRAVNEQVAAEQAAQQTQGRINQLDDETRQAVAEYRATIQETASLRRYNAQLEQTLKSQLEEMQTIQKQVVEIETTAREIVPFMQKMLATLEEFVKLDMPFLPDERARRIADLKDMMARADVSIAEKFRRIVEAYQVEMEYGRTLETYQGKIGEKTVDVLRAGRVSLMYQTLDGAESGYWDVEKKQWVKDNGYGDAIKAGLKIARKQAAPDLLTVPVSAPKEAK
ncbi:DUF3450 domain-containing protein [Fontimonas sp. SYSU GA230001]|uniref:DUF3450 domain-containing protein n=1 Tax=Fontimonas sp. SYSU GA230001 TaxID=3142450 RepID=UPI0032B3F983